MRQVIFITAIAGTACVASADVINVNFVETGAGRTITVRQFDSMGSQLNSRSLFAGELIHTITGGTGANAALNGDFATFCADITEPVSRSASAEFSVVDIASIPVTNSLMPAMGADKALAIRSIFTEGVERTRGSGMSNDFAAAFQLMIWEIVSDFDASIGVASLSASEGELRFQNRSDGTLTNGVASEFETLRSRIAAGDDLFSGLLGVASAGLQDQLVVIPTPATMALAGFGGLLAVRRRR
jgi:hypothetical protein